MDWKTKNIKQILGVGNHISEIKTTKMSKTKERKEFIFDIDYLSNITIRIIIIYILFLKGS